MNKTAHFKGDIEVKFEFSTLPCVLSSVTEVLIDITNRIIFHEQIPLWKSLENPSRIIFNLTCLSLKFIQRKLYDNKLHSKLENPARRLSWGSKMFHI